MDSNFASENLNKFKKLKKLIVPGTVKILAFTAFSLRKTIILTF